MGQQRSICLDGVLLSRLAEADTPRVQRLPGDLDQDWSETRSPAGSGYAQVVERVQTASGRRDVLVDAEQVVRVVGCLDPR